MSTFTEFHKDGEFEICISGSSTVRGEKVETRCVAVATRKEPFLSIRSKQRYGSAQRALEAIRAAINSLPPQ